MLSMISVSVETFNRFGTNEVQFENPTSRKSDFLQSLSVQSDLDCVHFL